MIGAVVRWFVTLAPGYFFNDITNWAARVFNSVAPGKTVDENTGRPKVWVVLVVILAIAFILALIFKFFFRNKR
jgi:hypothetical protein